MIASPGGKLSPKVTDEVPQFDTEHDMEYSTAHLIRPLRVHLPRGEGIRKPNKGGKYFPPL